MDFEFEDDIFQSNKRTTLSNSLSNKYVAKVVTPKVNIFF